ncbi:PEP-CTERM sorting domain-containing protein [Aeoliella sp. ICT_H6.2]|uniref:PEP-CTERM sorting domain-containing protein n=1 Tax=Aeoliella straminimaris TaxID=2954799 RepID=A0A9X2FE22_9BACT|nr:PEP-CTERM sorting domain-containing protein [Aeoliella straminimaris]MCO6046929.1 PEP-CTERM sorting domain-containing protein [Aeoliella straminimaris]
MIRVFLAAAAIGVFTLLMPPVHAQGNPHTQVMPPESHPFGKSHDEWSAEWWQWAVSLPADNHPLFDTAEAGAGQPSDHVWFLGGTFTSIPDPNNPDLVVGEADRAITVPSGTALFFPVMNAISLEFEEAPSSEEDLREEARFLGDHRTGLFAEVDGVEILDLDSYRVETPLFTLGPLPDNNIVGVPEGQTLVGVDDGVYLMLAPLSVGEHSLDFGGALVLPENGFEFRLDIHYDITVVPRGRAGAIPEPATVSLVAVGCLGFAVLRRRRRA